MTVSPSKQKYSVANEWTTMDVCSKMDTAQFDNKNNWSAATVEQKLSDKYDASVEAVKAAFREAYR